MDALIEPPPRDTIIVPADSAPFRKVIDSTTMLTIARFAMPGLITIALAGLGWVINDLKTGQRDGLTELKTSQLNGLNELKDGQRQVWTQVSKLADVQATTNNVQSALVVKVDGTVKQLDRLQTQVDGLQKH